MNIIAANASPPTVSVVVPTYQRRALVVEAVRSALRQTFDSFEVIVVDDGSTDGTADALAALHGRLRYLRQDNRGVAAARNAGIAAARGTIVAFLDSDDLWLPDHLATLVRAFEQFPDAILACTSPHLRGAVGDRGQLVEPLPRQLYSPVVRFISTIAIRLEALQTVEGFDELLPTNEDGDLSLRVALLGPFAVVPRRTAQIRRTRGSYWQRSRASGAFLEADERILIRFVELALELREQRPEIVDVARGRLSLNRAMRGIVSGDKAAVRVALAEACRAIPELSSDPQGMARRLSVTVPGMGTASELARTYAVAAELWPEPRCDTALVLRSCAVASLTRAGELRQAVVEASRLPLVETAALVVRHRRLLVRVAQERARGLFLRGTETGTEARIPLSRRPR